jgi:hypothetical protein
VKLDAGAEPSSLNTSEVVLSFFWVKLTSLFELMRRGSGDGDCTCVEAKKLDALCGQFPGGQGRSGFGTATVPMCLAFGGMRCGVMVRFAGRRGKTEGTCVCPADMFLRGG